MQVRAGSSESEALLTALKGDHYYSSQTPETHHLAIEGTQLHLECSPARSVFVSGRGSRVRSAISPTGDLMSCTVELGPSAGSHWRVTVIDAAGKRAWTNPFWLEAPRPKGHQRDVEGLMEKGGIRKASRSGKVCGRRLSPRGRLAPLVRRGLRRHLHQ